MTSLDEVIVKFLKAQKMRLKRSTYNRYKSVMNLYLIYLNNYGYQSLDKKDLRRWESHYETDEEAFTKIFNVDYLNSNNYSEFLEYFLIRKAPSSESFLKQAMTVLRTFAHWLFDHGYINQKACHHLFTCLLSFSVN